MQKKTLIGVAAAAAIATAATGGIVYATVLDDDDTPITGPALERASQAAIDHLGGGEVTDTEVGDEDSYYEVEVTLDGEEIDVQLDEDFVVVGDEVDSDDDESGDDD